MGEQVTGPAGPGQHASLGIADVYRRYATAAGTSPLSAHLAEALASSAEALQALATIPARGRRPALVLAALHDLALAGRAPTPDTVSASVATLVSLTGEVAAIVARRTPRTLDAARCAVLYPAVAEAARGAGAVGLVAVGTPAGLDVQLDRVGVSYGDGRSVGDPSSPVRLSARVVGDRPVPQLAVPEVVARVVVDADPLDLTDADDARWLRACVPPDRADERARLEAALAVAAPASLLRGDPVELLPEALARVPAGALPVVTTAWAISRLAPARRAAFRRALTAAGRPVAWVSVEGVGVAPGVPTLGDRPASGHSIVGLTGSDPARALGRCWSRGRVLSWLAD